MAISSLFSISAHLVEHGAALIMSVFGGILLLVPFSWGLIQLLVAGLAMLVMRAFVIFISPFIARNAVMFTDLINIILLVIDTVVYAIRVWVVIIMDIIFEVEKLLHLTHKKKGPTIGEEKHTEPLDPTSVRKRFNEISRECPKYNGIPQISDHITKQTLSEYVCPVIRAASPLDWVGDATETVLGPFSYDATPLPGERGHTHEINCEGPEDQDVAWSCVILGSGYVVIEILIPLLIGGIFLYSMGGSILRLVGDVLRLVGVLIGVALNFIFGVVLKYI